MSIDMEKTLYERYPLIFAQLASTSAGIECGEGWFHLLDVLCERLQFAVEHWGAPQVVATQVKSKFGVLRFYSEGGDDRTEGMIRMAEALSGRICIWCGGPGKARKASARGREFVATFCDDHVTTHGRMASLSGQGK